MGAEEREILRAAEVSRLLGLSPARVYALAAARQIPCRKVGRAVYFPRRALLRWLEEAGLPPGEGVAR